MQSNIASTDILKVNFCTKSHLAYESNKDLKWSFLPKVFFRKKLLGKVSDSYERRERHNLKRQKREEKKQAKLALRSQTTKVFVKQLRYLSNN